MHRHAPSVAAARVEVQARVSCQNNGGSWGGEKWKKTRFLGDRQMNGWRSSPAMLLDLYSTLLWVSGWLENMNRGVGVGVGSTVKGRHIFIYTYIYIYIYVCLRLILGLESGCTVFCDSGSRSEIIPKWDEVSEENDYDDQFLLFANSRAAPAAILENDIGEWGIRNNVLLLPSLRLGKFWFWSGKSRSIGMG